MEKKVLNVRLVSEELNIVEKEDVHALIPSSHILPTFHPGGSTNSLRNSSGVRYSTSLSG